jgi:hypothetical protein
MTILVAKLDCATSEGKITDLFLHLVVDRQFSQTNSDKRQMGRGATFELT